MSLSWRMGVGQELFALHCDGREIPVEVAMFEPHPR